jgi:hypothetical protein
LSGCSGPGEGETEDNNTEQQLNAGEVVIRCDFSIFHSNIFCSKTFKRFLAM